MEKTLKPHPTHTNYGVDANSDIYNIKTSRKLKCCCDKYGYNHICIRMNKVSYSYRASRFIFECNHGLIEDDLVIDHIDNNQSNDKIENLQKISQSANVLKKFTGGYVQNTTKKAIEATNCETGVKMIYKSIYGAGKILNIIPASVNRVIKGNQLTAISKTSGVHYTFKLI